jgi:predicted DNA-binding protein
MKRGRMVSTTVYLKADTLQRLKTLTRRTGIPMAVIIRSSVEERVKSLRIDLDVSSGGKDSRERVLSAREHEFVVDSEDPSA